MLAPLGAQPATYSFGSVLRAAPCLVASTTSSHWQCKMAPKSPRACQTTPHRPSSDSCVAGPCVCGADVHGSRRWSSSPPTSAHRLRTAIIDARKTIVLLSSQALPLVRRLIPARFSVCLDSELLVFAPSLARRTVFGTQSCHLDQRKLL